MTRMRVDAVCLVVLGAVGISRPINENERFVALGEGWQNYIGGDVSKVHLLEFIRNEGLSGHPNPAIRGH